MKEVEFRHWLTMQEYDEGTINSRISNCLRVEKWEGDLDAHFSSDMCSLLLDKLSYTSKDESMQISARHGIPIIGNIRNGTATLKQATKLYVNFSRSLNEGKTQKNYENYSKKARVIKTNEIFKEKNISAVDSYFNFLDYFNIDKKKFYEFGIENTIYANIEDARKQWAELKYALLHNSTLSIRGYGRLGKNTIFFLDMYKSIFNNSKIEMDKTNNAAPKRNIQNITGHQVNKTLFNYQCSHIFGKTKNPLLFEAVWNICFTPKIFDPLTGHEAKGIWPEEYQELFLNAAYNRFYDIILDYNNFLDEWKIEEKINKYVDALLGESSTSDLVAFRKDALSEWEKIRTIS